MTPEQEIEELRALLAERSAQLVERDARLAERDAELGAARKEAEELRARLAAAEEGAVRRFLTGMRRG